LKGEAFSCKMRRLRISIPYNVVSFGDKPFGLDAHFWDNLSLSYRRVLLVRSIKALEERPSGCRLESVVDVERQLADLREIAKALKPPPATPRRSLPLSLLRIASLILPYRVAEIAWRSHIDSMTLEESSMASAIASQLLAIGEPRALNSTMWLNVDIVEARVNDKILGYFYEVDEKFASSLREVIEMCRAV